MGGILILKQAHDGQRKTAGPRRRGVACALALLVSAPLLHAQDEPGGWQDLAQAFVGEVDRRLQLPADEQATYAELILQALAAASTPIERSQWLVVVDRSALAQLAMVWWLGADGTVRLVGASPASTGLPRGFEHFETPLGVFDHSLDNLDFRAEGTRNELGLRGYGRQGLRVFDFGWVVAERAWAPGRQPMRLQLHATDPDRLEPLLGQRHSKGCVRVPATLVDFLDRHAVLDAAYEAASRQGRHFWLLRADRAPTPWSGRYLVVVDSRRRTRPDWARPAPMPRPSRR